MEGKERSRSEKTSSTKTMETEWFTSYSEGRPIECLVVVLLIDVVTFFILTSTLKFRRIKGCLIGNHFLIRE